MADSHEDILALDIGGSHIKGTILNTKGEWQIEYKSLDTPKIRYPGKCDPDHHRTGQGHAELWKDLSRLSRLCQE
jgi:hypothetical protein